MSNTFSKRYNIPIKEKEITVRYEAPEGLRIFIVPLCYDLGKDSKDLRSIVCRVLKKQPDPGAWGDPYVTDDINNLLQNAKWSKVYDLIEALHKSFSFESDKEHFSNEVNEFFVENGIGWKIEDGLIQMRGDGEFEASIKEAVIVLDERGKDTSKGEIKEAILDLSRKPEADATGAVQHSLAALECVVREVTGNKNATLGKLINDNKRIVPTPMDDVISKMYGYASNTARHVKEGGEISFDEAELVTHLSASICTYLAKKNFAKLDVSINVNFNPWE